MSDLHALVAGFADVAAAYERGRPDYPPFVVERIVAELGVNPPAQNSARPRARVLDLAAGTGKLARPLLAAGLDVVAVEPLERMRAALARAIAPSGRSPGAPRRFRSATRRSTPPRARRRFTGSTGTGRRASFTACSGRAAGWS